VRRAELLELHGQSIEALQGLLQDKQNYLLMNVKMRAAGGEAVNPHEAREVRRDIARIKTLIREKEKGIDRSALARQAEAGEAEA
jgi:large subunit ribosomal protein L29